MENTDKKLYISNTKDKHFISVNFLFNVFSFFMFFSLLMN